MKKTYLILAAALLLFASCNSNKPQDENEFIDEQTKNTSIEFHSPALLPVDSLGISDDFYKTWADQYPDGAREPIVAMTHLYKTGTFTSGTYEGQTLVTSTMDCEGPCRPEVYRFAFDEKGNKWTLLAKYSSTEIESIYIPFDSTDSTTDFPEFDVPESLKVWENNVAILKDPISTLITDDSKGAELVVLDDPSFATYQLLGGCILGISGDSVAAKYSLAPTEFYDEVDGVAGTKLLTFTDTNGAQMTKEYTIEQGGCGLTGSCILTEDPSEGEEAKLVKIGSIGDNSALMFPSLDEPSDTTRGLQGSILQAYNQYKMQLEYSGGTITFEDFIKTGNLFFVKMGTGKFVMIRDSKFQSGVECGKPVIYLYPQKDTKVSVKVGIDSFTKTIPAYGNGWNVLAHVGGLLTNLADNKNYPYLFWEGNSLKNLTAPSGWTLKKSEVESALPVALHKMGLSASETRDFMEFWAPRLAQESKDYIEFSFVGNELMDQIAPLTISPKPDTVLRVFMYYRGVDSAGLPMQNYTAPARKGFTVVEWGGTLR